MNWGLDLSFGTAYLVSDAILSTQCLPGYGLSTAESHHNLYDMNPPDRPGLR